MLTAAFLFSFFARVHMSSFQSACFTFFQNGMNKKKKLAEMPKNFLPLFPLRFHSRFSVSVALGSTKPNQWTSQRRRCVSFLFYVFFFSLLLAIHMKTEESCLYWEQYYFFSELGTPLTIMKINNKMYQWSLMSEAHLLDMVSLKLFKQILWLRRKWTR